MNVIKHRENAAAAMADNSILICYAGIPLHENEDEYHSFRENSNYFWLTGLQREKQVLVMIKSKEKVTEYLFIEEPDDFSERWTGKMPKKPEVAKLSGLGEDRIFYLSSFDSMIYRQIDNAALETAYFDTYKCSAEDLDDYNLVASRQFAKAFPALQIRSLRNLVAPFRKVKDEDEVADVREAIKITAKGLEEVLKRLKPGMKEYQVQAVFEGTCEYEGATRYAFPTIAGSGLNACSMHYNTNRDEIQDGDMILLDLGAKYHNYCSDITRTYPASGKYSPRQRQIYDLVLSANKAVAAAAKPGITLRDLNDITKKVLGEGLVKLGLIKDVSEVGKYYMHSVSHSIGIDCHDETVGGNTLEAGWIISNEPGFYIDEERIGIRIEDDLLITEDGCEVLSKDIIREADEIEAYMAANHL